MNFTSLSFLLFFLVLFVLYWSLFHRFVPFRNLFLLVASYFFYGWWDYRFPAVLASVSLITYAAAIMVAKNRQGRYRKTVFWSALSLITGLLLFFKYYNFFAGELNGLFHSAGLEISVPYSSLFLPVGISFYSFICISYLVDVYQGKIAAETNVINAWLSFSFFPVILAGPVQRPAQLLPQLIVKQSFSYPLAVQGSRQLLWGAATKILIADPCAPLVEKVFSDPASQPGSSLLTGALLFSIQIYADFAGYSNMAIGISKLLGFNIVRNFDYPYFSRDIRSFWQKWNMSLTTWFRDYIFLPLSYRVSDRIRSEKFLGMKSDYAIYIAGASVTWLLTGLWHGASYSFVFWGIIHGTALILYHLTLRSRKKWLKRSGITNDHPGIIFIETLLTLAIIIIAWIFFRSKDIRTAWEFLSGIFSQTIFDPPLTVPNNLILMVLFFFILEWIGRKQEIPLSSTGFLKRRGIRWSLYYLLIIAMFYFSGAQQDFIYFKF